MSGVGDRQQTTALKGKAMTLPWELTRKQELVAKIIRNEWLSDHRGYHECEAHIIGAKVICFASNFYRGRRIGEKRATFTVGPRGGVKVK